ncbi:MAG: hypothetical protein AVDCRST_MAG34-3186, partial [uncultured Nocardioidaceae bacterium]
VRRRTTVARDRHRVRFADGTAHRAGGAPAAQRGATVPQQAPVQCGPCGDLLLGRGRERRGRRLARAAAVARAPRHRPAPVLGRHRARGDRPGRARQPRAVRPDGRRGRRPPRLL